MGGHILNRMIPLTPADAFSPRRIATDSGAKSHRRRDLLPVRKFAALVLGLVLLAGLRAAPALPPPHDISPTPEHPRNTEGAFVTLRSGRILFSYSQFSEGQHDHSPSAIAEIYSDDRGKTWSQPRVAVPTGRYQNIMSVSFLRLASGKIARFHCVKRNKWLDCHPLLSISTDEGTTWSEPKTVLAAPGYFVLNNDRIIQTSSGRIVIPLGYHRTLGSEDERSSWDSRAITLWIYSDDEGATWKEANTWWGLPVASASGLQEPGVVQLPDGSLYGWSRTDQRFQYEFTSKDDGLTWTAPVPTSLSSPNSPASIKRVPQTDTLMVVYNDHSGRVPAPEKLTQRAPLVAAFSTDGAKSWGAPQVIEDDLTGWFCYTAIHFTDEAVLLAYVAGNDQLGRLSRLRIRSVPLAALNIPKAPAR